MKRNLILSTLILGVFTCSFAQSVDKKKGLTRIGGNTTDDITIIISDAIHIAFESIDVSSLSDLSHLSELSQLSDLSQLSALSTLRELESLDDFDFDFDFDHIVLDLDDLDVELHDQIKEITKDAKKKARRIKDN